jgi:hypothetical protein
MAGHVDNLQALIDALPPCPMRSMRTYWPRWKRLAAWERVVSVHSVGQRVLFADERQIAAGFSLHWLAVLRLPAGRHVAGKAIRIPI